MKPSAAKVKQSLTSADSGKTTDPAQTTAAVADAAYLRGLAVRPTQEGWQVYSLDTDKVDSLHVTEEQARTWARQINVQSGLCCDPLASDAECAVCPDGGL